MTTRVQTLLFSSSAAAGAQNISSDGSSFEAAFNAPLLVPLTASFCEVALTTATIWNTSPNISAAFGNNLFRFTRGAVPHTVTIADGLYSLPQLNDYIDRAVQNLGHQAGLYTLTADNASQRTVLTIAQNGDTVDFQTAGSVGPLLGWPSPGAIVTATMGDQHFYSPAEAAFNRNDLYLIESDLVQNGLPVNALARGIIGVVPIDVAPGSQVLYDPSNANWFDASELIGRPRMTLRFRLLNQDLMSAPTSGDSWSFTVQIRWG